MLWGKEMMMSVLGRFVYRWKRMSPHYARSGGSSAIDYARQRFIMRLHVYPGGFHLYDTLRSKYRNVGSSELIIPLFSRCAFSTRRSDPDMRQCNTIDDLIETAYDHLDTISPGGIAAFWPSLVKHVQNHHGGKSRAQLNEQLAKILYNTMESMHKFDGRDIATIAISLAKIMKQVESRGQRADTGSLHRNLHHLLIGEVNSENKHYIFSEIAMHAFPILYTFDARSLSNLINSFGHAEYTPKVKDGRTIFDVLALEAMSKLTHFNSQDLSNMLWSYAKMESSNSLLWSYAKMESSNSLLFTAVGDSIVGMNDLSEFKPQELSNIIWAFATAGESHPKLFNKFGNHIVAMKDLGQFKPQHLSNIIWSYATSRETHPQLFKIFGDHIAGMKDLRQFKPQDFSNIIWAYATSGESHPLLFQKLAHAAIARSNNFNSQDIANFLWAYATVGIIDQHYLFTSFAPAVKAALGKCNSQNVANVAWSYAVANVNDHSIFNTDLVAALQAKAYIFEPENLFQLHQWQLWQDEIKSGINLPQALREKCRQAFVSQSYQSSNFQDDVVSVLLSIGLRPEEEVPTASGYRLDALVEVNGVNVGIEVDGPSHFINREATGSTLLKRRQVSTLDDIQIISVPYWEWNKFGKDRAKKQEYLRFKLGLS
jgi:hypothetical protein